MAIDRALLGLADEVMTAVLRLRAGLLRIAGSGIATSLLLGAWFFLVFPTAPLYVENQNTKFLHGMAAAGIGHLDQDWTANTVDVMPIFTGIVYLLHAATPPAVCYLLQIALFAVFLHAVLRIADIGAGKAAKRTIFPVIVGLLVVTSQFSDGGARVWAGVAQQYLLGPALEPQTFGVFFLLAVVVFLRGQSEAALWLSALPALIHPGYVVPAGTLILAFTTAAWMAPDEVPRPRLWVILGSLMAAGASMLYLSLMILPTSAESWSQANEILAKLRIPRHAVPAYWFDADAAAKTAGLVLALWLTWRNAQRLFWIMAVCFGIAVSLTALAALVDSNELGMISPWRISVYLVPLGLAVLLGRLVGWALDRAEQGSAPGFFRLIGWTLAVLTLAVTANGILEKARLYRSSGLPAHIAYMRGTGDDRTLYLTRPGDMNIRLQSGLPQLVSWKTHPYKDVEVLEWYRRYLLAKRIFKGKTLDCAALDQAIATYGTTHLLVDSPAKTVTCPTATLAFEGEGVRIYRLAP
ncbi:MAG: DUF6798 domain-containing protein [Alphaproteobacteria bacterium]